MPEEKDYISKVYMTLRDNVDGFSKTEDEFRSAIKEKGYVNKVYMTLKESIDGFDKSENEFASALGKPSAATQPGGGGGLSSPKAPGMDGGRSPFGMGSVAQKIGQAPIAQQPTIPPSEEPPAGVQPEEPSIERKLFAGTGLPEVPEGVIKSTITPSEYQLFVGKGEEPTITPGRGYKQEPTALQPEVEPDLNFERFKYTDKMVLNPFPNLDKRLKDIEEYADEDVRKMEKAKVFDDLIKYKNEQTKDYKVEADLLNQNLQQSIDKVNQIATALQDPQLPEEQRILLNDQAEKIQLDVSVAENRLNDLQSLFDDNAKMLGTLTSARDSMKFNYNNALELGVMGLYNATIPSLVKGVGSLFEFTSGITGAINPAQEYLKGGDAAKQIGEGLRLMGESLAIPIDSEINTDLKKTLSEGINSRNAALFFGNVLGSFTTTMATGGTGAAIQSFDGLYDYGKDKGLSDLEAGFFALPVAIVAGYIAPFGTEKFTKLLTSSAGKEALAKAIDLMKSNPNAAFNKILDISKNFVRSVLEESVEGGVERATEETMKAAFTGLTNKDLYDINEGKDFKSAVKRVALSFVEEGGGGAIIALLVAPFAGRKYGNLATIIAKSMVNTEKENEFIDNLENLRSSGRIDDQKFEQVTQLFQRAKQATEQIPKNIKDEKAVSRSVQLIMEQQDIEEQLKTVNPAMSADLKADLQKINEELARIAGGEIPQAAPDIDQIIQQPVSTTASAPAAAPAEAAAEEGIPLGTAASQALISKGEKLGFTKEQVNSMTAEERDVVRTASSKDDVKDLADKYAEQAVAAEATPQAGSVVGIEAEGKAKKIEEPTKEQQLKDVQEGNVATFTYETEKDVPDVFKDKISSTGEINGKPVVRVTVAKSLADYELSRQQAARAEEQQPAAERKPEAVPAAEGTRVQAAPEIPPITAADFEATDKTNKAGRKARQQIREQYGTDTAAKMEYITKNFEEAITNLEKQGKIRKICP